MATRRRTLLPQRVDPKSTEAAPRRPKWSRPARKWAVLVAMCCGEAQAQDARPTPPTPPPSAKPAELPEELLRELRAMRETNKKLVEQLERTSKEHDDQIRRLTEQLSNLSNRVDGGPAGPELNAPVGAAAPPGPPPVLDSDTPIPDYQDGVFPSQGLPPGSDLAKPSVNSLRGSFGPGFQFRTEDEEFRLQIHYESQIESRVWGNADQIPANSGIYLPRQRIFFNGNITKPIEYEFSINRGLNNINLLNAYINIHLSDKFEVRFGRFFTPLGYDQYAISNYWMPTPERSVFTTNVGLNRQIGLMAWGYLADKRIDYSVGVFNGSRNSFESLNNALDAVGFINARPFQNSETLKFAKFLNIGASAAVGHQDQAPVPATFRIGAGSPDANIPSTATVPFLILNRDVIERGQRLLGSVHIAYFYKSLSLIGEWQYGYNAYATTGRPTSAQVPLSGFYVSGGYFLTGEQVERRTRVRPLRPVFPTTKGGERGIGGWEAVGRVSRLGLGDQIFTGGFADPSLWSNQATTTELGLNWYLNDYMKVYFFWLHGKFADPVQYRPGGFQNSADMFWMRFQLYF